MYEIIIGTGVIILTQIIKNKVYPKYGTTGVHILTFTLALIGVAIYRYAMSDPYIYDLIREALQYLALSITIYEVILKKIGFKSASN